MTEQPDDEYVSPKLSGRLLSFGENSHFNNLLEVQGSVPAMQENSSTDTACKTVVSQDALLTTTISELGELTSQTGSIPAHLPTLTNME